VAVQVGQVRVIYLLYYSSLDVAFVLGSYDAKECTWEDSSKIPSTTRQRFIVEFEAAARKEGFDVDDSAKFIVLDEGARAGWRRAGWA
jgi:hypothetical protein